MDQKRLEYHERQLSRALVQLADQCRADVRAGIAKAGVKLDSDTNTAIGVLIGHAIREGLLMGRAHERWRVARLPLPAGNDRQAPAIPPLPKATSAEDPEYDAEETSCMRCEKPRRSCKCRKAGA